MNGEGIIAPAGGQGDTIPAGGPVESWFGGFPDELKNNELITGHDGPESLAKDYLETSTKYNELQTSLPTPPESPEAYQFEIPEGTQTDEVLLGEFKQFAFENKIPADLANKLVAFQIEKSTAKEGAAMDDFNQKVEQNRITAETALKKDWASNYDANVQLAQRVANKFLPEAVMKYMNDSGFGDNPELVKGFYEIGKVLSEDVFVAGQPAPKGPAVDGFGRPTLTFPSMQK